MRDKAIKVVYLVANEDITSPLLRRQVVELLIEASSASERPLNVSILLFQLVPSLVRRRKVLRELKKNLRRCGISLVVVPNLVPWPVPNIRFMRTGAGFRPDGRWNRFGAVMFAFYAFPVLAYYALVKRVRVFHSRSYPPALAVVAFKKVFRFVKHVFDPRSDFPEENVVAGRWEDDSSDFKFWKKVESKILQDASTTVCISEEYVNHFKETTQTFSYILAPNNVDTNRFRYDPVARAMQRKTLGWSETDLVFVYLGGMSADGWHRPDFYRELIVRVRERVPNSKLLMLIPRHANDIAQRCFAGLDSVAIRNPAYDEVPKWLSVGDIGLMYMHRRRLAVGTKLGEYLAVGLPILCNSNCLGTKRFIQNYPDAGRVLNLGLGDLDQNPDHFTREELVGLTGRRRVLRTLAERIFSNSSVAETYINVYMGLS